MKEPGPFHYVTLLVSQLVYTVTTLKKECKFFDTSSIANLILSTICTWKSSCQLIFRVQDFGEFRFVAFRVPFECVTFL